MSTEEILKLAKTIKPETLPEEWCKNEDMSMNYLGGFLTAFKHFSQSTSVSTKANGEAEDVEALQGVSNPNDTQATPAEYLVEPIHSIIKKFMESGEIELKPKHSGTINFMCLEIANAAKSTPKEAPQNNSGLRWVKASERLPDNKDDRPIRTNGTHYIGWFNPNTNKWNTDFDQAFLIEDVEWLDESGKEAPQVAVECYVVKELDDFPDKTGWYYVLNPNGEIMPRMIYFLGEGQAYWSNPTKINFTRWIKKTTLYTTK